MEDSLENLAEVFREKSFLLKSCLELRNLNRESHHPLATLDETLVEIRETLSKIRIELDRGKEDLQHAQQVLARIQVVKERVSYATDNLPAGLEVQKYAALMNKKKLDASNALASAIPKKSKQPSKIVPLTPAEYESVPKYIKGRLPCSSVDTFVCAFNKTIAAKYAFLRIPKNQMSEKELKKHQQFKKQETAETKGTHFCVMDDLKNYADVRPEPSTRTMLTILRHSSRIKEIRGPGPICRYAIRDD